MNRLFVSTILILSLLAQVVTGAEPSVVVNEVEQCCCSITKAVVSEMVHQCGCHLKEREVPVHEESSPAAAAIVVSVPLNLVAVIQPLFELPSFYSEQTVHFDTGPPGLYPNRAIYLQINRFLC